MPVFIKDLEKYLAGNPRQEEILGKARERATPQNGILSALAVYELLGKDDAIAFFGSARDDKTEQSARELELENALHAIARSVAKLWTAVEEHRYDARSLVGDETLNMKETLEGAGIELPLA